MSTKSKKFRKMKRQIPLRDNEELWEFLLKPSEIENIKDINLDPCAYDYPDVKQ